MTKLRDAVGGIEIVLEAEYGGRLSDQTLHGLAADAVAVFDMARIRNFIPILALREAQKRADDLITA